MITANTTDRLHQIQQPAFLTRIRLRCQRRVLWMRTLWDSGMTEGEQGLAISHSEVDRILADPQSTAIAEAVFYETDPMAQQLSKQIHTTDIWAAKDETWDQLCREFALSQPESDLLSLAVAVEVEPLLRRVYGYLHDDATAQYATPWLASSLFQWSSRVTFSPESALVRWRLAQPLSDTGNPWTAIAPWVADPHIVTWAIRGQGLDSVLGTTVKFIPTATSAQNTCMYPTQLGAMQTFVQAMRHSQSDTPIELELIAPQGAGKQTLAAQLCASLGVEMLVVDASHLLGGDICLSLAVERAMRAIRLARLSKAVLYWHNAEGVNPQVWSAVQGDLDLMVFGKRDVETPVSTSTFKQAHGEVARRTFHLSNLTRAMRAKLWQQLAPDQPVPSPVLNWMLTPGEIAIAARVAPAGEKAVAEACRQVLYCQTGELFVPLVCPYTWDDIVLSPSVRQHLVELSEQARLRWLVYEEWGFEKLLPLGRGITALFAGPSGTGKTMAAQVLARSLDMELYRVDLAGVINKYIGETEKRLKQVFDACERANVVLFFDEADALFGQRTQVKDAHDRFANIEIDYLLQRMEQFDGIAILATNRKSDLDTAFLRRLRFIIDFLPPNSAERLALWHKALLPLSPSGEELLDRIDWDFLASQLNMTGADIKAAALSAAFLARAQGTRITMQQVLYAARREMAKHGVVMRLGD